MAVYIYQCPIHNEFEIEHSMNDKLEFCPHCEKENLPKQEVKRLIASGTNFVLQGGGWGRDLYSSK